MKRMLVCVYIFLSVSAYCQSQTGNMGILQDELNKGTWVVSYFSSVLKSHTRDSIKQFVPKIEELTNWDYVYEDWIYWYEKGYFLIERIELLDGPILRFGDYHEMYINKIESNKSKLIIRCKENPENSRYDVLSYLNWQKLRAVSKNDTFNMIFVFDGDYLDIYINAIEPDAFFYSFCLFDDATLAEFESLMYYNTRNLSKVTFPRRADKTHAVGTECLVAENLRLRKEESTESATLRTMPAGTRATVLKLGKRQTIDGITAEWVQVLLPDGTAGWCFGGYLVAL